MSSSSTICGDRHHPEGGVEAPHPPAVLGDLAEEGVQVVEVLADVMPEPGGPPVPVRSMAATRSGLVRVRPNGTGSADSEASTLSAWVIQ